MSNIDKAFKKLGDKTVDLAEAIKSFDYRYILLAAIFAAGFGLGLLF